MSARPKPDGASPAVSLPFITWAAIALTVASSKLLQTAWWLVLLFSFAPLGSRAELFLILWYSAQLLDIRYAT